MTQSNRVPNGYKASGVDIAEADAGLRNIIARVTATWPKTGFGAVQLPIGYFANVVDIGGTGLALCTDGVGSKAIVAEIRRHPEAMIAVFREPRDLLEDLRAVVHDFARE